MERSRTLRSIVGGQPVSGVEVMASLNPARPDDVVANVELAGAEVTLAAAEAAGRAFTQWSNASARSRSEVLGRAAVLLDERAESIGRDIAREEGKTLAEAVGETHGAAAIFRYYAAQCFEAEGEVYPGRDTATLLFSRREPVGVFAAITPWNFPVSVPSWKIAPALAYGNTVVWKPSEMVPLSSMRLFQTLVDAGLPDGVLNLIFGAGDVGASLVASTLINGVTFTGSNRVGRSIESAVAGTGTRLQLELGGSNPAIVLSDADLDAAAEQIAIGAFLSTGQKCVSTRRVIVESAVFDEFSEYLTRRAREWTVGDPQEVGTKVGPLASESQLRNMLEYMEIAQKEKATFLCGGKPKQLEGDGYYFDLTILTDVPSESRILKEEVFGPVVTLIRAKDASDAIRIANDTRYGLSASIFTRDLAQVLQFARELRVGVVKVNTESTGLLYQAPFGGIRESSVGPPEQGKTARDFYTQWKTVFIDSGSVTVG